MQQVVVEEDEWADVALSPPPERQGEGGGAAALASIAWCLDHPHCRVTGPTIVCSSLRAASGLALPMPELPRRHGAPAAAPSAAPSSPRSWAAAAARWVEETLRGLGLADGAARQAGAAEEEGAEEEENPRALWLRHVEPTLERAVEAGRGEVRPAPLLRYSIEAASLFENRGFIWAQGRTCQDPAPVWILVGAKCAVPCRDGVEGVALLAAASPAVAEFTRRALGCAGRPI